MLHLSSVYRFADQGSNAEAVRCYSPETYHRKHAPGRSKDKRLVTRYRVQSDTKCDKSSHRYDYSNRPPFLVLEHGVFEVNLSLSLHYPRTIPKV